MHTNTRYHRRFTINPPTYIEYRNLRNDQIQAFRWEHLCSKNHGGDPHRLAQLDEIKRISDETMQSWFDTFLLHLYLDNEDGCEQPVTEKFLEDQVPWLEKQMAKQFPEKDPTDIHTWGQIYLKSQKEFLASLQGESLYSWEEFSEEADHILKKMLKQKSPVADRDISDMRCLIDIPKTLKGPITPESMELLARKILERQNPEAYAEGMVEMVVRSLRGEYPTPPKALKIPPKILEDTQPSEEEPVNNGWVYA